MSTYIINTGVTNIHSSGFTLNIGYRASKSGSGNIGYRLWAQSDPEPGGVTSINADFNTYWKYHSFNITNINWDSYYNFRLTGYTRSERTWTDPGLAKTDKPKVLSLYAHDITHTSAKIFGQVTWDNVTSFRGAFRYKRIQASDWQSGGYFSYGHASPNTYTYNLNLSGLAPFSIYLFKFEVTSFYTSPWFPGQILRFTTGLGNYLYRAFATLPNGTEIFGEWKQFERPIN